MYIYIYIYIYICFSIHQVPCFRVWQSISKTVLNKFVLYSDCAYIVLPTCVEFVNATVL